MIKVGSIQTGRDYHLWFNELQDIFLLALTNFIAEKKNKWCSMKFFIEEAGDWIGWAFSQVWIYFNAQPCLEGSPMRVHMAR